MTRRPIQHNSSPLPPHRGWQVIHNPNRNRRGMLIFPLVLLILLVGAAIAYTTLWPFTPAALRKRLRQHSSAVVEFGSFHQVFFPRPGFIAENVVLRANSGAQPGVAITRLTLLSSYTGLISKSISSVHADGLIVRVFAHNPAENIQFHRSPEQIKLTLDHLVADGALLQVITQNAAAPLSFPIPRLRADNFGRGSATKLDIILHNSLPAMTIALQGQIGPWRSEQPMSTPLSASFNISNGDLASVHGIGGKLSGAGRFTGQLQSIDISGHVDVDAFQTQHAQHPLPLHVTYTAHVQTRDALVQLQSAEAHLAANTTITGYGTITPRMQQSPDLVNLQLTCEQGRVDDLLRLFVRSPRPSMIGPVRFHTTAIVERGEQPFLQRVRLIGHFAIDDAQFTSPNTEEKLNELEARSQGDPRQEDTPERAISLISADVNMRNGIAALSNIRFQVPGAVANGDGTFSVLNSQVQLQGKLRMAAELSHATKGIKSFLLKALDPLYKKKGAGAELPVSVTGTAPKAKFKVGLKK